MPPPSSFLILKPLTAVVEYRPTFIARNRNPISIVRPFLEVRLWCSRICTRDFPRSISPRWRILCQSIMANPDRTVAFHPSFPCRYQTRVRIPIAHITFASHPLCGQGGGEQRRRKDHQPPNSQRRSSFPGMNFMLGMSMPSRNTARSMDPISHRPDVICAMEQIPRVPVAVLSPALALLVSTNVLSTEK